MSHQTLKLKSLRKFSEIAAFLPRFRRGKNVHVCTIHRWRSRGCRGVYLRAVKTPSGWCTTLQAVRHFLRQITAAETGMEITLPSPSGSGHQRRIEAELEAFGL